MGVWELLNFPLSQICITRVGSDSRCAQNAIYVMHKVWTVIWLITFANFHNTRKNAFQTGEYSYLYFSFYWEISVFPVLPVKKCSKSSTVNFQKIYKKIFLATSLKQRKCYERCAMIGQSEMRRRLPQRARPEIRQRPYFPQYMIFYKKPYKIF